MLNLKQNKNKLILTVTLEVIFTILLILLLVYVRQKSIAYLYDIQNKYSDITTLGEELSTKNLSTYDQAKVDSTLTNIDSKLEKGINLVRVILPLSLILLSLVFYFLIWRVISKVKIKRFLSYSILPIIFLLSSIYFTLDYIAFNYGFTESSSLIYLITSIILLTVTYYMSLFQLSNNKTIKENIRSAKEKINKVILPFIITLLTNILYIIGIFIIFFLSYVKADIIIPSILLLVIIILMNLERLYLVNKINSFKE